MRFVTDLAVTNRGDNSVEFLLGNGQGDFPVRGERVEVGVRPIDIQLADFDQDNLADLITVNKNSNNVTVVLQRDGLEATPYGVGATAEVSIEVDVDGDGRLETVTATAANSIEVQSELSSRISGQQARPPLVLPMDDDREGIVTISRTGDVLFRVADEGVTVSSPKRVQFNDERLQAADIELIAQPTKEACRTYNHLREQRTVAAVLHLTC